MKNHKRVVFLARVGLVAGMYTALTLCLAPLSFGPVQCRLAEALTVLAAYTPAALPGLTVGCLLSNLLGLAMGAGPAGVADVLVGPLATGLAALAGYACRRYRLGGLPVVATLPPVVFNALAVGTELALVAPTCTVGLWLTHTALVAAGQLVACVGGGLFVAKALQITGLDTRLFGDNSLWE